MNQISRRKLLELMVGVGCVTPLATMAATWKQVSANAGGGQTWKPIPYTGPAGTNWKKLGGSAAVKLVISANAHNYNIYTQAVASGWDGVTPVACTVTVNSGVAVGSTSTATYSMDTGTGWPAGSTINLINNGYIAGHGGRGGTQFATVTGGGPSLNVRFALTITNASGYIYGGGGGGGYFPAQANGGQSRRPDSTWNGSGCRGYSGNSYTQCGGGTIPAQDGGGGAGYDPGAGASNNAGLVNGGGFGGGGGLGILGGACGGGGGGANTGYAYGGIAINGSSLVTWVSGNARVYGMVV